MQALVRAQDAGLSLGAGSGWGVWVRGMGTGSGYGVWVWGLDVGFRCGSGYRCESGCRVWVSQRSGLMWFCFGSAEKTDGTAVDIFSFGMCALEVRSRIYPAWFIGQE